MFDARQDVPSRRMDDHGNGFIEANDNELHEGSQMKADYGWSMRQWHDTPCRAVFAH